jgi:anti-anti-sigma factor
MSAPSAKMSVFVGDKYACVKIAGRANFTSSIDFKALIQQLLEKGCNCFILDLADCMLMDSTFLGVLADFGLKMNTADKQKAGCVIELFNPSPRIAELLETIGVLRLFKVAQGEAKLPDNAGPQELTPSNPTREEVTRVCLEAHQTLMNINPDNVSRFKDVAAFLAEDLKKLKARPQP